MRLSHRDQLYGRYTEVMPTCERFVGTCEGRCTSWAYYNAGELAWSNADLFGAAMIHLAYKGFEVANGYLQG